MFLLLMLSVNYLQVFRVNSLAAEPGNIRVFDEQLKNWRGEIIAAGGGPQQVIAESKMRQGRRLQARTTAGRDATRRSPATTRSTRRPRRSG